MQIIKKIKLIILNLSTRMQHYISDYFIKKFNTALHFYIDGTFIYPSEFKQSIAIFYYDNRINKRMAGLFALINNKKEKNFKILFFLILNIYDAISINKIINTICEKYSTNNKTLNKNKFIDLTAEGFRKYYTVL